MRLWKKNSSEGERIRRPGAGLNMLGKVHAATEGLGKKLAELMSVLLLAGITLIPIVALGWLVFFTDMFVISAVTVTDARPHTAERVKEITEEEAKRSPFGRRIFFAQTDLIETRLLAELPQLRTAHVVRRLPGTLMVIAQEKTPALLLFAHGNYYFVDDKGLPYEEARLDTLPEIVIPIVKSNDDASRVELGVPALGADFVSFVLSVQKDLPDAINASVAEIRIPSLAAREVHFRLDNNWMVRFDVGRDPKEQIGIMKRVIDEIVSEEEKKNLEYIDLRIENKVYYKTKSQITNYKSQANSKLQNTN